MSARPPGGARSCGRRLRPACAGHWEGKSGILARPRSPERGRSVLSIGVLFPAFVPAEIAWPGGRRGYDEPNGGRGRGCPVTFLLGVSCHGPLEQASHPRALRRAPRRTMAAERFRAYRLDTALACCDRLAE